jgi:hypothetical protein
LRKGHDGSVKAGVRYLSAPGTGNRLYCPPGVSPDQIGDIRIPLLFTEGEKKTLALARLAYYGAATPRFLPFGLIGVYGFRGKLGKKQQPDGSHVPFTGLIGDISALPLLGRLVYILFDVDVHTNKQICNARAMLAEELTARGAKVVYVDLPAASNVNGVDDLLALEGPERVLPLFLEARAWDVVDTHSPASALLAVSNELQLFRTDSGETFVRLSDKARKTVSLKSTEFSQYLGHTYYQRFGKSISSKTVADVVGVLQGKALYESPTVCVFVRVANSANRIFVDLCDDEGNAVEIRPDGWSVVRYPSVVFRSIKGQLSLPRPKAGGSIDLLRRYLNLQYEDDWILCVAWIIGCFQATGPFPILILQGEQGSAKSTAARFLRRSIDPCKALLRPLPKDERDLAISASHSLLLAFDNLSGIRENIADALCRISTGGGFAVRALYTDSDEVLFEFSRPIILNGIDRVSERQDLTDRAIVLTLPPIPSHQRRDEATLSAEFERDRPFILGAVFDAVSCALRRVTEVTLKSTPRLADFAKWVTAAEPALGLPDGAFLAAFSRNRAIAVQDSLEDDPLVDLLRFLMDKQDVWEGSCKELRVILCRFVGDVTGASATIPTESTLSKRLRRLQAFLREAGMEVSFDRSKKKRTVMIQKCGPASVTPVTRGYETAFLPCPEGPGTPLMGDMSAVEVTGIPIGDQHTSPLARVIGTCTFCTACGPIEACWDREHSSWKCPGCGAEIGESHLPHPPEEEQA